MSDFSPSDAALEGFRVLRQSWRVVVGWSLFNLIALVALAIVASVATFGAAAASSAGAVQFSGAFGGLLASLGEALTVAVLAGGLFRLMLRPQEPGFLHLRIGADELRIFGVWVVMVVAAFLLAGVCAALVLAGRGIGPGMALVAWGLVVAAGVWLGLRFSLASVVSFAERRFTLMGSWRLTRGQVWPLLGMTVLSSCVVALMALLVAIVLMLAMGFSVGFGAVFEAMGDADALATHPGLYLAQLAAQLVLFPAALVLLLAPWVSAYAALSDREI
ncbi:hypothetical protein [Phenylobacterium sp.]|uniref:hypothetical protein n=1 Tax=Phenylobacterium sp. TaxID=1871053 RepID=UPI002DE9DAFA|nr:hypothetical protein [Phenylobacterium sp.]